jgi:putative membrane protein
MGQTRDVDSGTEKPKVDIQLMLASERTLLSWIRTGLAMMGFGFVVARFGLFLRELATSQRLPQKTSVHLSVWLGTVLVALGVIVFVAAARDHARYLRRIESGNLDPIPSRTLGVMIGLALAALGVAMVAYLIVLALTE